MKAFTFSKFKEDNEDKSQLQKIVGTWEWEFKEENERNKFGELEKQMLPLVNGESHSQRQKQRPMSAQAVLRFFT